MSQNVIGRVEQLTGRYAWLGVTALAVLVTGCATAPRGMNDILSQIPGVSIVSDISEIGGLAKGFENDNLTENQLRDAESRPVPSPPGLSFELGMTRRAIAALMRGNFEIVVQNYSEVARHNKDGGVMFDAISDLAAKAELLQGNDRAAIALYRQMELRWISASQRTGKPIFANSAARPNLILDYAMVAVDAGRSDEAERILRDYPARLSAFPEISSRTRVRYEARRYHVRGVVASHRGDDPEAYVQLKRALDELAEGTRKITSLTEDEQRETSNDEQGIQLWLVRVAASLGQFSQARYHLQEMERSVSKMGGVAKNQRSRLREAEAAYYALTGDYRRALASREDAWSLAPSLVPKSSFLRFAYATERAMLQVALGDLASALNTLASVNSIAQTRGEASSTRYIGIRAYASAMSGNTKQQLRSLDLLDTQNGQQLASATGQLHFVAKTVAYHRRAASTGSEADLKLAVDGGRTFSRSLRAIRASGSGRETPLPPSMVHAAKEAYLDAVSTSMNRNGVTLDDLFDAISLLQVSETDDDIAAAALRRKDIPGVSAAQLRRLQDLQMAARAAQKSLAALVRSSDATPKEMAELMGRANAAASQLQGLLIELQRASPALGQAFAVKALTVKEVQARLGLDEALTAFVPVGQSTLALFVTKSTADQRLLSLTPVETKTLTKRIRDSVTFDSAVRAPTYDLSAAKELYQRLFGWTGRALVAVKGLTVVTSGSLASIPFGLLVGPEERGRGTSDYRLLPWLIRSYAVTHAPSIASWYAIATSSGVARRGSFVAWADPDFSGNATNSNMATRSVRRTMRSSRVGQRDEGALDALPADLGALLPALPETRQEAQAVATALGASLKDDVVLGGKATRASVLQFSASGALSQRSIVMFATHGLAPATIPGLHQPALAMARDSATPDSLLLTLDDVVGLNMNADWVLLSACNTSAADREGGDALSGLARGFFFAGAKSLLVTHWEVESESAAAITVKTLERYSANPRLTRALALQQTAIELIEAKKSPVQWAHPAYWAPYALVGDGRR